jgi:integrase
MNKRTGTIIAKPSGFFARVWVKLADGTEERRWINLQTKDRTTAKRKLARLVAALEAGEVVAEAEAKVLATAETYRAYTLDRNEKRKLTVVMARDEQNNRVRYIYPHIGELPLSKITDDHVRQILEAARDRGLSRGTVVAIRSVLARDMKRARIEKLIEGRPVEDVELPEGLKRDRRPFTSPSDALIAKYLGAAHAFWDPRLKLDLECKLVVIVSRTQGGMRTAEIIRWDWTMLDLDSFAVCKIARAKTDEVQTLEIPEVLRPFLAAWWARAGKPVAGPVFPVRRGPRAGKDKKSRGTSFAARFRRDFFRAGCVLLPPVKDEDGTPTPNPADALYNDTAVSQRMNFHSLRRAYDRALARVPGMNIQTAMTLTGHTDEKTHMRYVREAEAARPVPIAALPFIEAGLAARLLSPAVTQRGRKDRLSTERDTSLELATFGLGSRRSTN